MDHGNLRRKDTTKGPPLRVLSLDGGGVRGYSMLIILQELLHRAFVETEGRAPRKGEIPKPCEYFDLIGGTGTGGLIALMLGRLRLDIQTSMDVYVRMTKKVFETDKTIAGIPYKQTLFKASKLEEAIKQCVREHTLSEAEGNDGTSEGGTEIQDISSPFSTTSPEVRRSMSVRSNSTIGVSSPSSVRNSFAPNFGRWGNADASLYDGRENRTKTAVTAVYKGTNPKTGASILLRSYDSRKEPSPEFNCTIWQAGRATSATGLAFKPIKIGQNVFIDEGAGKYNPSPQLLEEAAGNEWPGRDMGVFVSVGTGKRPGGTNNQQHEWWEGFVGGSMGNFAEARRRLISKIEGCEDTHVQMVNVELPKRGIPLENYCRLNVEVGVGEFGMNEWDRLSDISISTHRYLQKPDTKRLIGEAATKMAKIELTTRRLERGEYNSHSRASSNLYAEDDFYSVSTNTTNHTTAVELPADDGPLRPVSLPYRLPTQMPHPNNQITPVDEKYMATPGSTTASNPSSRLSAELPNRFSDDKIAYQTSPLPPRRSAEQMYSPSEPPPRPPKTPINDGQSVQIRRSPMMRPHNNSSTLPYPDTDGPPPIVSKLKKPEFRAQ